MTRFVWLLLLGFLLGGCAGNIPKEIRTPPPGNPPLQAVRAEPQRFTGVHVRWGGTIAEVQNRRHDTWVEVVARDLENSGRPIEDSRALGRFLVKIRGFVDPAVLAKGKALTVSGVVEGMVTKPIGDYPYRFPVVGAQTYYLWEPLPKYSPSDYPPWYYDPWYPFYYPYGPWPRPFP
ncbi:MAG: Slp family lipoprotein [Gammaproteobacteria bacterium]